MHRPHLRNEGLPAIVAGCTWSQATSWMLPSRPCARPDDIATYLFLDEALVARFQNNQPAEWDFFDRSKWIPQVRGFVDDIVNAPGVESARRLFLFAATGTFVFVAAWLAWYWQTTVRFRNRPMMPISGAKSPRFRPRPRVFHLLARSWCLVAVPWTWHMEIQPVRSLAASSCKRRKARAIRSVRPSGLFQTEELVLGDRAAR